MKQQIKAVMFVKKEGNITNKKYQGLFDISKKTASRELSEIVAKKLFIRKGTTGKGTFYILTNQRGHKGVILEFILKDINELLKKGLLTKKVSEHTFIMR